MSAFCRLEDLITESDVEQKLIMPALTATPPLGLGYDAVDIRTKSDIKTLTIDKGKKQKLYYPDYAIVLAGLPVMIVEAKKPGESLDEAYREARLYATELNAQFPTGLNPCHRIVVSDGTHLNSGVWDSIDFDVSLAFHEITAADAKYADLTHRCSRQTMQIFADTMLGRLKKANYWRPVNMVGGMSVRNEEIGHNTFGAAIALKYRHLFNPRTREDRAFIAKNAYVPSNRRDRYVDPIDQVIRGAIPPSVSGARMLDTSDPKLLVDRLRAPKTLEREVLLLIGNVGAGKSTFIDHLKEAALPTEVLEKTVWIRINLNEAPVENDEIYDWLKEQLIRGLKEAQPGTDFDLLETLMKVFQPQIERIKKGALALLDPNSEAYKIRLSDDLRALENNKLELAKALVSFVCKDNGKGLIVALDNCDKKKLEQQLLMFQVAQWIKEEFKCLVFLPLRDVTYDHYRDVPPLDTALKDLVFRIEAPLFSRVLEKRIHLALYQMRSEGGERRLSYLLKGGTMVDYPASDQAMYLVSIMKSLYEHDRIMRRIITALAGRNIRQALEIFLEFCTSGHIDEGEILQIRNAEGKYCLPYHIVTRVLLRLNRRFYDGDGSYLKNLFQCDPRDSAPDHFARLATLRWLRKKFKVAGPTNVRGYHRLSDLVADLVPYGHDANTLRREILYLVRGGCIFTEHQRDDRVTDEDLISLSPAGWVHLDLVQNTDYLAAAAEDLWYDDQRIASEVATLIGGKGMRGHYLPSTGNSNAATVEKYLEAKLNERFRKPELVLNTPRTSEFHQLDDRALGATSDAKIRAPAEVWHALATQFPQGAMIEAEVNTVNDLGAFVRISDGADALISAVSIRNAGAEVLKGDRVQARVARVEAEEKKMYLIFQKKL
jgi:hypothetical protein